MTTFEVNIPLLRKAVEWAEAEAAKPAAESQWRQGWWVTPRSSKERDGWGVFASLSVAAEYGRCDTCYCIAGYVVETQVGPSTEVREVAKDLLGLTGEQADTLFEACNQIEDIRRIAEEIAGESL